MIGCAQPKEASKCFKGFGRDVDRSEVPAAVKSGEHDGIEAICFTVVARSSWDQGWSDDLAVKAVTSKDSLEHKAGTGSFIAGSDWTFVREPTEKPTDLHEIRRQLDDLDALTFARNDGSSD